MDEKKPKIRKRVRPITKPISEGHDPHKPVGYKNPPKPTQFQKGQSGNPKGRPKGHKNVATIAREQLYKLITVSEKGRVRKVPLIQALIMKVMKSALEGDKSAQTMALKLINQCELDKPSTEASKQAFSVEEDAKLLEDLRRMQLDTEEDS